MSDRTRPWSVGGGEDLALQRYVRPAEVARHVPLPGPSSEGIASRLAEVYGRLAAVGIGYCAPALGAGPGRQWIRPPDQVLRAPRHATCLDLALVLCGACTTAGLHTAVVVLDSDGDGVGHAVVLVRLDHGLAPRADGRFGEDVWPKPPSGLLDELQDEIDGPPGDVVAVDPVGMARSLGTTDVPGLGAPFADAVRHGAAHLRGGRWRLGVDVGRAGFPPEPPPADPSWAEPLRPPYRAKDTAESPLRLLRAEYQVVPFTARDELTVLRAWCREVSGGATIGLAVITGVGGAGKTRLGLELAERLRREGWYAGTLPKHPRGVAWLAHLVSPVLVVVDYADGRREDTIALLAALRRRSGPPAVVVLTARSAQGQWLDEVIEALDSDAHPHQLEHVRLPDQHPEATGVYRRAFGALTPAATRTPPPVPPGVRWTTLDFVLLAWVAAAENAEALPASREDLYDEVLRHEENYWATVYRNTTRERSPNRARLRDAAACVTLVAAAGSRTDAVLGAVDDLRADPRELQDVRETLVTCLRSDPDDSLELRPDPVGGRLVLTRFATDEGLFRRTLAAAGPDGVLDAVITLSRAGQDDPETAVALVINLLDDDVDRWSDVLLAAVSQQSAATAALEALVRREDTPLPLADVSRSIPFSSTGAYGLGLVVDERRLEQARREGADDVNLVELVEVVWARASNAGEHARALALATEAVDVRRRLADGSTTGRLHLAKALSNLGVEQGEAGDPSGALASAREAADLYTGLDPADQEEYLPVLATLLNNLSVGQRTARDLQAARFTIDESVAIRRRLAEIDPDTYLVTLAEALINLAAQQRESGDHAEAVASISESVEISRRFAETDTRAHLPVLAKSLTNLGSHQHAWGDAPTALAAAAEAVEHYRRLVGLNPTAYLPDLATAVGNLSVLRGDAGDRRAAVDLAIEAVGINRRLSRIHGERSLAGLATALVILADQQASTGEREAALASVTEAVTYFRRLADADPETHGHDLTRALISLGMHQAATGDHTSAQASAVEAVERPRRLAPDGRADDQLAKALSLLSAQQIGLRDHASAVATASEAADLQRDLAGRSPAALPDLAETLTNLAVAQSRTGDLAAAVASTRTAVAIRSQLAQQSPHARLPELCASLNNLAGFQGQAGDHAAALRSTREVVALRRRLARASPAVHLPALGMSLNNLAFWQGQTGDHPAALTTIIEAIAIRRRLVAVDPDVHLPDLAASLDILANERAESGDHARALTAAREAVDTRRPLAAARPAVHLPELAGSLVNLANEQIRFDVPGALALAAEAVDIYRGLSEPSRTYHLPRLAASLSNLASIQENVGDQAAAMRSATEAAKHFRGLCAIDPDAHRPNLAKALSNMALRQEGAGDAAAALRSSIEALGLFRDLARAAPLAFLPSLVQALGNHALRSALDPAAADAAWRESIEDFEYPAARAELRAEWAFAIVSAGHHDEAARQAVLATAEAARPLDDNGGRNRAAAMLLTRARAAARRATERLCLAPQDVPLWASVRITEEDIALLNAYGTAAGWPGRQAACEAEPERLVSADFRRALRGLADLHPTNPVPGWMLGLLDEVDELGLTESFRRRLADHDLRTLLDDWMAAPDWNESHRFFTAHRSALAVPRAVELLAADESTAALQHRGILALLRANPEQVVFSIVGDPSAAEDAALDAIENARLGLLECVLAACPDLADRPVVWNLAMAVLLLRAGEQAGANRHGASAAEAATELQRNAAAVRLRGLAAGAPQLAGVDELLTLLVAPR